jgi:hypothetical protein
LDSPVSPVSASRSTATVNFCAIFVNVSSLQMEQSDFRFVSPLRLRCGQKYCGEQMRQLTTCRECSQMREGLQILHELFKAYVPALVRCPHKFSGEQM